MRATVLRDRESSTKTMDARNTLVNSSRLEWSRRDTPKIAHPRRRENTVSTQIALMIIGVEFANESSQTVLRSLVVRPRGSSVVIASVFPRGSEGVRG